MSLASSLERLLQERGWSVSELARGSGISRAHVWAIVRGRYRGVRDNPMLETLERLAWALKVSEADVIGDYPALTELNQTISLPFAHYVALRDIPLGERPPSAADLRELYDFRKVFLLDDEPATPRRKKKG